jgi:hypothetical protein
VLHATVRFPDARDQLAAAMANHADEVLEAALQKAERDFAVLGTFASHDFFSYQLCALTMSACFTRTKEGFLELPLNTATSHTPPA